MLQRITAFSLIAVEIYALGLGSLCLGIASAWAEEKPVPAAAEAKNPAAASAPDEVAPSETPAGETAPSMSPHAGAGSYTSHPNWLHLITDWPENYSSFFSNLFAYEPRTYGYVAGSTLALLPFDDRLTKYVHRSAQESGLMYEGSQDHAWIRYRLLGRKEAIFGPRSTIGVFWYFGDGMFSTQIAAGFALTGYASGNYHSTHVAFQIIESMMIAGPTVLAIKMATGREAPSRASRGGGVWHSYPGLSNYLRDQPRYYSYPSGHTTTAVSTLIVLAENYPEQTWILPVGGTMVGLLMLALMTAGSHWPSDYPLALMIGYTSAHATVTKSRERYTQALARQRGDGAKRELFSWDGFSPLCEGITCGLQTSWTF